VQSRTPGSPPLRSERVFGNKSTTLRFVGIPISARTPPPGYGTPLNKRALTPHNQAVVGRDWAKAGSSRQNESPSVSPLMRTGTQYPPPSPGCGPLGQIEPNRSKGQHQGGGGKFRQTAEASKREPGQTKRPEGHFQGGPSSGKHMGPTNQRGANDMGGGRGMSIPTLGFSVYGARFSPPVQIQPAPPPPPRGPAPDFAPCLSSTGSLQVHSAAALRHFPSITRHPPWWWAHKRVQENSS